MSVPAQTIHVVAVGARTPVGLSAESAAAAVRAGVNRLGTHPFMVNKAGELVAMAVDPRLDANLSRADRLVPLAASAIQQVIDKLGKDIVRAGEVLLALPEARPGFLEADAKSVAPALIAALGISDLRLSLCGRGHAGALQGLHMAVDRLGAGRAEICTVVGVDSYADPDTVEQLEENLQLLSEKTRSGFIPGEGAGAVVLSTANARKHLRLPSLAVIRGVGAAMERRLINTDADVLGEGLAEAIGAAAAGLGGEPIDATYCDINGERYRTDEWGFALLRLASRLSLAPYETPSDLWGDVGAASGALGCVLAVRSWARGYAPGPRALVWASSEAGLRGAAVLQQPGS
jgi:3-oxoacyl-[acyl-carrier-protein] synthase I